MLKIGFFLSLFLVIQGTCLAGFQNLVGELHKKNTTIKKEEYTLKQNENQIKAVESTTNLFLDGSATYREGRDASLFSFSSQETKSLSPSVSLGLPFSWGGVLKFTHEYTRQDISMWDAAYKTANGGDIAYLIENKLSYSQDLSRNVFGKSYRLNLESAELNYRAAQSQLDSVEETTLLELYSYYLNAKLSKTMLGLNRESLDRSRVRKKLIEKRYKDGIAIRADYFRVGSSYLVSEELLENSKTEFEQTLNELSMLVERDVLGEEIAHFDENFKELTIEPKKDFNQNKNYQILKKRLSALESEVEALDFQDNPDVKLSFEYSRGAIDNNYSDAFSDAQSDSTYDSKAVVLSFNVPFGESSSEITRVNKNIEAQKVKLSLTDLQKDLHLKNDQLYREFKSSHQNIQSAQRRLDLGKKVLKEQTKRYERGQVDLDQVLNAEDELLGAEKSYFQYIAKYQLVAAQIALLHGEINDYLKDYNE
ncbi:MAG: TolC family protein [Halobacteriovoraceae bacterium]|nr:TolC family protein [Halobacteriovoraceae bacterium]